MMKAILVDDKTTNILLLKDLITKHCPSLQVVATASNPRDAYDCITRLSPDIVFLDIEMPGSNGFDLLSRFKPAFFEVIFTTAYSQYAVRAFREQAIDYLLKPIQIDDLLQSIRKAERQIDLKRVNKKMNLYLDSQEYSGKPTRIRLPSQHGFILADTEDILRCEASGSYTMIHFLKVKKMLVSLHLKSCEELLPTSFFRVHHSHIINLKYVYKYIKGRGGQVILLDGTEIDVAANRKTAFIEALDRPF